MAMLSIAGPSVRDEVALRDSLSRVHPRMRASWLRERGLDDSYYTTFTRPDSQGLREVGRWSFGPSYDVDGRVTPTETLVALARGSGVSLLRFSRQDSLSIELLSDINAPGLLDRVWVRDTLLYVGSTAGLEIWNIADERNPSRISWIQTALNDFYVQDSLAYVIGADDSFKVYNVSDPASPTFRGACRDSGYDISVCNGYAYIGDRWGLYVIDVSNPISPHRIGSWGSAIEQVLARGHLCYVTTFNPNAPGELTFHILDVAVPSLPYQIGSLDSVGGYGVYLVDTLAFCSGDADLPRFSIVSVADSNRPYALSTTDDGGWGMGIWASGLAQAAFVCYDWGGLHVYDTRNTSHPVRDTFLLDDDAAVDVCIDNGRAYVADWMSGLKILDISDPARPTTLGSYDTAGQPPDMASVVARDSFAFVDWFWFRVVDVSDPAHPTAAGQLDLFAPPEDMVIRDSFVYVAEVNRFQIVNVARPREPVLVGSCVAGDATSAGLWLADTVAYVANDVTQVVNVADPASPQVVGQFNRGAWNVSVTDTFAFVSSGGILVYSVAAPTQPRLIDSLSVGPSTSWVEAVGSLLYVGSRDGVRIVDISDVHNMRVRGFTSTPYSVKRLTYTSPYLYASCWEAGVCILESTQVAVDDAAHTGPALCRLRALPSPATGSIALTSSVPFGDEAVIIVRDVMGKEVIRLNSVATISRSVHVDVTCLPCGLYYVEVTGSGRRESVKFVKY